MWGHFKNWYVNTYKLKGFQKKIVELVDRQSLHVALPLAWCIASFPLIRGLLPSRSTPTFITMVGGRVSFEGEDHGVGVVLLKGECNGSGRGFNHRRCCWCAQKRWHNWHWAVVLPPLTSKRGHRRRWLRSERHGRCKFIFLFWKVEMREW